MRPTLGRLGEVELPVLHALDESVPFGSREVEDRTVGILRISHLDAIRGERDLDTDVPLILREGRLDETGASLGTPVYFSGHEKLLSAWLDHQLDEKTSS